MIICYVCMFFNDLYITYYLCVSECLQGQRTVTVYKNGMNP